MTLPVSGAISLRAVNTELGLPAGNAISLNDSLVRGLFAKPSGAISLGDGYGKTCWQLGVGSHDFGGGTIAIGFELNLMGTRTPTTFKGSTIRLLWAEYQSGIFVEFILQVGSTMPQSALTAILINGHTYIVGGVGWYGYTTAGGFSEWRWRATAGAPDPGFSTGVTYPTFLQG